MHYQITEDELFRLQSCEKQLRLISDLCCHAMGSHEISLDGLMHFINAQEETLATTLAAVEGRFVPDTTHRVPAESEAVRPRAKAPTRKRERLTAGAA